MISHDAFLVLCALIELGGTASKKLLTNAVDKRVDRLLIDKIIEALLRETLIVSKSLSKRVSIRDSYSNSKSLYNYKTPLRDLEANKAAYSNAVDNLLVGTAKMANADYRAVVDGTKARRSPVQQFAGQLSRQDLPEYWKQIKEMEPSERREFSADVARMAARGR